MGTEREIVSGDLVIRKTVFAIENYMKKGHYGSLRGSRYSDCFAYVLSGCTRYNFGSYEFTATAGTIVYLAKGSGYEMDVMTDRYEFVFVDFFFDDDGCGVRKSVLFKPGNKSEAESLFRKTANLWLTRGEGARLKLLSLLYSIYAECVYGSGAYVPKGVERKIKPAYDYILANYNREIPENLGAMCGMTETHFRRLFKKAYGMSPVKYINKIRVERAMGLLLGGNLTLSQIAENVGYSDAYYFSRRFKALTGVSPGAYKKSHLLF